MATITLKSSVLQEAVLEKLDGIDARKEKRYNHLLKFHNERNWLEKFLFKSSEESIRNDVDVDFKWELRKLKQFLLMAEQPNSLITITDYEFDFLFNNAS